MQILSGLHRIECPIGNRYISVYVVVGGNHIAVVDVGYHQSITDTVVPYFENIGMSKDLVRYVVITHSDFDHSGGIQAARESFPQALVCAGERDRRMIENLQTMVEERYGEFSADHGFDESEDSKQFIRTVAHEGPVDIGLTGGERFNLGGRFLEVIHTPGHSPGHLSVLDESNNALIIGDAVLGDTHPLADGSPAFPPTYRSVEAYRATIRLIQGRKLRWILASHEPAFEGEDASDFLDKSLAYTDLVETVVLDTIRAQKSAVSLLELVELCHERLGPWPDPAYRYLVYPLMGHLEALEKSHLVQRDKRDDGLGAWRPL